MIPCISAKSINYLYGTADEKYNFSKDFFRKTHFPQIMNRYFNNKLIESVSENDLLEELEEEYIFGNRVFVIFGSTGSGKSELLCWIKDKWLQKNNKRPIIRISRNELNPQILVKKCFETLGFELNDFMIDENKWDILLNKPITIINQMVWSTMAEIFDTDEHIVPAAMLFRPVIEKNILEFTNQIRVGHIIKPLVIISKEEFDLLIESTSFNININYHKIRDSLQMKLDQFLFQGYDIKTIFKQLSNPLIEKNIRPILLIDDLVQSLNLYAADILDFFITLEEGNWDVVIGLTPGVEQGNGFNSELKTRIRNLDTIDDRIKKLWLSDEAGSNFYTLEKEDAHNYLRNYLLAIKEANNFKCSEDCPKANSCKMIFGNSNNELDILPFNKPLINRIFDGIPSGKGALRYLILNSREVLKFLIKGNPKSTNKIFPLLNREVFIDHDDKLIKLLTEMYANPIIDHFSITKSILKHFKYDSNDISVPVNLITNHKEEIVDQPILNKKDPLHSHIRDWLEGSKVKEQIIEPLRSGVATIIHEITKGTSIVRPHTSRIVKTSATVQRNEVINRYKYPISFNGNDKTQIVINKNINLLQIANFQQLKMQERPFVFENIANDWNLSEWIYQTEIIKKEWKYELERDLGYTIEEFAFYFKKLLFKLHKIGGNLSIDKNPIQMDWLDLAEDLFLDWFAIRDNIVDYNKLELMLNEEEFNQFFLLNNYSKSLNKYQIKNIPLGDFLGNIQSEIKNTIKMLQPVLYKNAIELLSFQSIRTILTNQGVNLEEIYCIIKKEEFTLNDLLNIDIFVNLLSTEDNKKLITQIQNEQRFYSNIYKILPQLKDDESASNINDLNSMNAYLSEKLKLRSQVRKHFINLVEKGETQLPKKQWKGILRDIEELNPNLFDNINVKINIR
jgi:hypothetical protein